MLLKESGTQKEWLDEMQTREELYKLLDYDPTAEKMGGLERLTICRRAYRSYNQRTTWVLKQNHNTARDWPG